MVQAPRKATSNNLTLQDFLALPQGDIACELLNGHAIPKVSPQRFHSKTQKTLLIRLESWNTASGHPLGEVGIEWSVTLKHQGRDWVPVPELLFVSCDRLPNNWTDDGPCPVPPELAIEIISPDQTFGEMAEDIAERATDYLAAGISRVWIVDPKAKSITVFFPNAIPITHRSDSLLTDELLPSFQLTAQQLFDQAGLN